MSAHHPPSWYVGDRDRNGFLYVFDGNGSFVASLVDDEEAAHELVDAFNVRATHLAALKAAQEERDRLAILVGRLTDNLERFHIVGERDRALLREARAALKRKGKRP